MPEPSDYELALSKGERFFERGTFPLAKRELEIAQRLRPSEDIAAKLRQCEVGILVQNAKEAVKKGRKLEKKGKLAEALEQFEQAQAALPVRKDSPEDWLPEKIEQLRQQMGRNAIVATIAHAEREEDWEARLAIYEQTLTEPGLSDTEQQALGEKKLIALVRLERHDEARAWGRHHPPLGASACYHLGYAKAARGAILDALSQWLDLSPAPPALRPQIMALLPLAYREACDPAVSAYADLYDRLLPWLKDEVALAPLLAYFKLYSADTLWQQGRYPEAARLLLPLPRRLSLSELGLYARLLLQLAEEDIEQLRTAITLWLTAIHNTSLLERLVMRGKGSAPIPLDALRGALQQELDQLIERHDREGRLDKGLQRHYRTEKQVIEALAHWALPCEAGVWPCTPAFAAEFGLSGTVLERIEAWRGRDTWDESIFSAAVYFSASGHSLLLAEEGALDKALAELPKAVPDDKLGRYCRQRVAWLCGIDLALAGNTKGKVYLMEALPLLVDFPHYRKELIDIALGERPFRERIGLADAMEWLARQFEDTGFREATASLLCQKAIFLANQGIAQAVYKRFVDQAAALCPDCYMVKDTHAQLDHGQQLDQLYKALHKGKLSAAVAVIGRYRRNKELAERFFSVLSHWFEDVSASGDAPQVQLAELRDMLFHTRQVDPAHPLNVAIGAAIKRLEK
ncbi:MAG: hypothetical protein WCP34_08420 [Pseudomonadota bacterium]